MKLRYGFVSNSSTTSFCIYGALIQGPKDIIRNITAENELFTYHYSQDGDGIYVGRNWSGIGGEETGNQFKKNVEEILNKYFPDLKEFNTFEEAWYDG